MSFELLKNMIAIPSYSHEEKDVADYICSWLENENISYRREKNNILLHKDCGIEGAPSLLLNSHIDTVKPSSKYTLPITPVFTPYPIAFPTMHSGKDYSH